MSTTLMQARDLEADLAICEAASPGPWIIDPIKVVGFIAEARQGWPYAIRQALSQREEIARLEDKIDRLVDELRMERDRQQYRSGCYD